MANERASHIRKICKEALAAKEIPTDYGHRTDSGNPALYVFGVTEFERLVEIRFREPEPYHD